MRLEAQAERGQVIEEALRLADAGHRMQALAGEVRCGVARHG